MNRSIRASLDSVESVANNRHRERHERTGRHLRARVPEVKVHRAHFHRRFHGIVQEVEPGRRFTEFLLDSRDIPFDHFDGQATGAVKPEQASGTHRDDHIGGPNATCHGTRCVGGPHTMGFPKRPRTQVGGMNWGNDAVQWLARSEPPARVDARCRDVQRRRCVVERRGQVVHCARRIRGKEGGGGGAFGLRG